MTIFRSHPSGLTFADVIRSLLVRIRALETRRPEAPRPPSRSIYRVAPTTWGVAPPSVAPADPAATGAPDATARRTAARKCRRLEMPIFRLPVPRGLPAT